MKNDPDSSIALKMLPPTLFRDTLARLTAGQSVRRVARWLMTKDRGELQHHGMYEIRKQVAQLKGSIDRNEDLSIDLSPGPQARQTEAVPAYDVHLQKLLEMAMEDRVAGRDVLLFLLCTELERLRELRETGGAPGQLNTALMHLRRIADDLCKLGSGPNAGCKDYPMLGLDGEPVDPEQGPKQFDPETLALIRQVQAMDPADRMLGIDVLNIAHQIVKLEGEIERERRQEQEGQAAAPPPEDEPQP